MSAEPFFTATLNVRFNQINIGQHLDYAGLLEMAGHSRELFYKHHQLDGMNLNGVGNMLKSLQVEYLSQSNFNDSLRFDWYADAFTRTTASVVIKVFNESTGKLTAIIQKKFVFYDYIQRKVVKVPEAIVALWI